MKFACTWKLSVLPIVLCGSAALAVPFGSTLTYQGSLTNNGTPLNGIDQADMRFTLYADLAGTTLVAGPILRPNVDFVDGLFTVTLDFGAAAYDGNARFVFVEVAQPAGSGIFTGLMPLQELTPIPYAVNADKLGGQNGDFYRNATNLNAGTISTARLPTAVMLTTNNQTVTGTKTFSAAPALTAAGAPMTVTSTTVVTNLNADLLDGQSGAFYLDLANATGALADARLSANVALLNNTQTITGAKTFSTSPSFTNATVPFNVTSMNLVTNLNADKLDGQHGAFYQDASNLNAGTIPAARLPANVALLDVAQAFTARHDFSGARGVSQWLSTADVNGSAVELRNNTAASTSLGSVDYLNSAGATVGQVRYDTVNMLSFRTAGVDRANIDSTGTLAMLSSVDNAQITLTGNSGGSGLLRMYNDFNTNGTPTKETVFLDAEDGTNAGSVLFMRNGDATINTIELDAEEPGAAIRLRNDVGTTSAETIFIDAMGLANAAAISLRDSTGVEQIGLNADENTHGNGSLFRMRDGTTISLELRSAETATTGGGIRLRQDNGLETLTLLADETQNAGGLMLMKNSLGVITTIEADADEGGAGIFRMRNDVGTTGAETVLIDAEDGANGGGLIILRNGASTINGMTLDGDSAGSGLITMRTDANTSFPSGIVSMTLDAEDSDGGAVLTMRNSANIQTVRLDADENTNGNTGGFLGLELENGVSTVEIRATDGVGNGSELILRQADGVPGVQMEANEGSATNGGAIYVFNDAGTTTIELDGDFNGDGRVITQELQITGGSDLSEQFDVSLNDAVEPGDVVCIDENNPGKLLLSRNAYDFKVAGIISGAGGVETGLYMGQKGTLADGQHPVALTGRVYVKCDATAVPIKPGDLITTSDIPGHAMKAVDRDRSHGAVLGKAMTGLNEGRGLVLVLVSLQ